MSLVIVGKYVTLTEADHDLVMAFSDNADTSDIDIENLTPYECLNEILEDLIINGEIELDTADRLGHLSECPVITTLIDCRVFGYLDYSLTPAVDELWCDSRVIFKGIGDGPAD